MGFINYLIDGISLGSVYTITALGYIVVYSIAKILSFAHGDVTVIGSYVVFVMVSTMGLSPMAGVLLAVAACMLLGMTTERTAYKPLHGASPLAVLITAIGISCLLQNVTLLIFGADTKPLTPMVTLPAIKLAGGGMAITGETVVIILSCVIIMIGPTAFINKSKAGQAMLAVFEDRGVTTLMGINISGITVLTFAIGSVLAAITSVLLCLAYPFLTPYTGSMSGIKAFVAAVLGGIGSIPGVSTGGILLGIIEILSKAYISSQMSDAIAFSVLIIMLLVRPTGILGKKINEKVQVSV